MKVIKVLNIEFSEYVNLIKKVFEQGDIVIHFAKQISKDPCSYIVMVMKSSVEISKTDGKSIVLERAIINELEQAIENLINLISVSHKVGRKITSCIPSLFLDRETPKDGFFLDNCNNIILDFPKNQSLSFFKKEFDLDFCIKNLNDRLEGVQIIAEANSSTHLSGKFHDYFRFFEKAFNKENRGLIKPLSEFLEANIVLGYSTQEIEKWIKYRHESIHANGRNGFLIEKDILDIIYRVEQAVNDVLFNKESWNNVSLRRRNIYEFKDGSFNENGDLFVCKEDKITQTNISYLDETESYLVNLKSNLNRFGIARNGWWAPIKADSLTLPTTIKIKDCS